MEAGVYHSVPNWVILSTRHSHEAFASRGPRSDVLRDALEL